MSNPRHDKGCSASQPSNSVCVLLTLDRSLNQDHHESDGVHQTSRNWITSADWIGTYTYRSDDKTIAAFEHV